MKSDVGVYSYSYGDKPHAVRSAGNITFQYDANGRMAQRAVTGGTKLDMEWNADNLPTLIKKDNAATTPYSCGGNGQRVPKTFGLFDFLTFLTAPLALDSIGLLVESLRYRSHRPYSGNQP